LLQTPRIHYPSQQQKKQNKKNKKNRGKTKTYLPLFFFAMHIIYKCWVAIIIILKPPNLVFIVV
jgi:cell division protein FtsB